MSNIEELKKAAGFEAVDKYVKSGMVLGLGTGSTVKYAIDRIGDLLKTGQLTNIRGIPTSVATEEQAISLGIPLITLDECDCIDVAIDGADEVDTHLNLVKGRGGALLREKLVEQCAKFLVIIVDETKICKDGLGTHGAMPVEVNKFAAKHIVEKLSRLPSLYNLSGLRIELRKSKSDPSALYVTDNSNYIADIYSDEPFSDAPLTASEINAVCGVVEHGLFLDMADIVICAGKEGITSLKK